MSRILSAPGKFVIGAGELARLAAHVASYGSPLVLVAHRDDEERVRASLDAVGKDGVELIRAGFSGECTHAEIDRIRSLCRGRGAKAVIGLGGGKALDTAKAAACEGDLPAVVIPTIASTDAPCSRLAVIYDESHALVETRVHPRNPDLVVVDSAVIARAPVRFLVAGMGDAYATYYEGRACIRSGARSYNGAAPTAAAFALAGECLRLLLEDSEKALLACGAGVVTPALENIIEANILLSGIGFESVGLAAAHAVHGGFTELPETHAAMHGEKVAVGTLVQLLLENAPLAELEQTLRYYDLVGLPTTLAGIGVTEVTEEKMRKVAARCVRPGGIMHNMPFPVDEDMVCNALMCVDSLDRLKRRTACDRGAEQWTLPIFP